MPFITGYAADEWWTVAVELHRLRLLPKVDVPGLAAALQYLADGGGSKPRLLFWPIPLPIQNRSLI